MTIQVETMESGWTIIDGINGLSVYPETITIMEAIKDYGFSGICSIDVDYGYCARLSMPGYLDCTDWVGPFYTEDDARSACLETYVEESEAA